MELRTLIFNQMMKSKSKEVHFKAFQLYMDYNYETELDRCKSPFLKEFIDRNIVDQESLEASFKLEKIDDKEDETLLMTNFNKSLELAYANLIKIRQYKECFTFMMNKIANAAWFETALPEGHLMHVEDRIKHLANVKICLDKTP